MTSNKPIKLLDKCAGELKKTLDKLEKLRLLDDSYTTERLNFVNNNISEILYNMHMLRKSYEHRNIDHI